MNPDFFDIFSIPRGTPVKGEIYDMTYKNLEYVTYKILHWKMSPSRKWQMCGERYYRGYHDILRKKRLTIDAEDHIIPLHELLPNNKFIDNQYAKMVQQKVNYIFSKPFTFQTENEEYKKELEKIFNDDFLRILRLLGEQSINCGVGWLHPYYDMNGDLRFKAFNSWEICPIWVDETETTLAFAIRVYPFKIFKNNAEVIIDRVELYTPDGIEYYILENSKLIPDDKKAYITVKTIYDTYPMNWGGKIPLIPFKSNSRSIPLITCCKSLQDGINKIMSIFGDVLMENMDSSLLVVKGFSGDDKEKDALRLNFLMKRTLFVNNDETEKGDVNTLTLEVDHTNYEYMLTMLREQLIQACKGYNIHDKRFSASSANQMNVQTAFSDMDLDTNGIELEYQYGFKQLLYFINKYLQSKKIGNFENEKVDIQFKRDTIINMESLLQTLSGLGLELPQKIMYDHVSWITDTKEALDLLQKDRKERIKFAKEMSEATGKSTLNDGSLNKEQKNNMDNSQRSIR